MAHFAISVLFNWRYGYQAQEFARVALETADSVCKAKAGK
jgi:hypothetical protein